MKTEDLLKTRSNGHCELCNSEAPLNIYDVPPAALNIAGREIYICNKCLAQVEKKEELDPAHWNCLTTAMWSEVVPVQVVSWRMLNRLRHESWAAEQIDMMYFDEETLAWAKATGDHEGDAAVDLHKDANGAVLNNGDSVVLTKTLDVKGSTLKAAIGTVVKNIRLVPDNTDQIEGKIEGQTIVILTKYLRKQHT